MSPESVRVERQIHGSIGGEVLKDWEVRVAMCSSTTHVGTAPGIPVENEVITGAIGVEIDKDLPVGADKRWDRRISETFDSEGDIRRALVVRRLERVIAH